MEVFTLSFEKCFNNGKILNRVNRKSSLNRAQIGRKPMGVEKDPQLSYNGLGYFLCLRV